MTELQRAEYDAWRQVCHDLTSRGAINKFDLDAPVGRNRTSGERLLNDIRAWGELRVELHRAVRSPSQPNLAGAIVELERLVRELPDVAAESLTPGRAAVQAYMNALRVIRHAIGEEDA